MSDKVKPRSLSRRGFLSASLRLTGEAIGVINPIAGGLTAMALAKQPGLLGELGKGALHGTVHGGIARIISSCGPNNGEKKEDISYEIKDLSNPVNDPAKYHPELVPLVLSAVFVRSNNIADYNIELKAQLNDPNNQNFIGNVSQKDVRSFLDWVSRSKANQVNQTIDSWLLKGDPSTIGIDKWSVIRSLGSSSDEHALVLETIAEQGIGGNVKLIGYYQDIWQIPKSNILRRAMVVEFQGKQYMVKMQHLSPALEEVDSLFTLNQTNPNISVTPTTAFKLNKSSINRLTISVSDMVVATDGSPAQTLENLIASGGNLTAPQMEEMMAIYQANIKILMSGDSLKVGADSLQPRNIVINQNGNLVVIDALSSKKTGLQITLRDGLIVSTDSDINKQIIAMRNILKSVGFSDDQIAELETSVFSANQLGASDFVQPGQRTLLTVIEEDGTQMSIPIENQSESAVIVPKVISQSSFETFSLWFNRATAVLLGLVIGNDIATKVISTDPNIEAVLQPEIDSHNRRKIDFDLYYKLADGPTNQYGNNVEAQWTHSVDVNTLKTQVLRHRKVNSMRAGLNLPQDDNRLKFRVVRSDLLSYDGIDLWADVNDAGFIELNSKILDIQQKNGTFSLSLIPDVTILPNSETDPNAIQLQKDQFDQLDFFLINDLKIPGRFQTINTLNRLKEDGNIDFWTITDSKRIIYGKLIGNNLEIRLLAEEDPLLPKYHVETMNYQTGKIDVKEKGVLKPVTIDELLSK